MSLDVISDTAGRAYGFKPGHPDEQLVRCGPGTLGGELLRRYWQPIAMATEATTRPRTVKVLDEELILFRNQAGEPGLLYPRCAHRGTNLLYGKVEQTGIRCCYHGWLFAPDGRLLDTPCEPNSDTKDRVRQPWYPVVEKFGLIFAYMGPPERQPDFPTISLEQDLKEGEYLLAQENTSGPNGPHPKIAARSDYNWFQNWDNTADPFHVMVTHYSINGNQFVESFGVPPEVEAKYLEDGVVNRSLRRLSDGKLHQRYGQMIMPNMHSTPGVSDNDFSYSSLGWFVPQDDTHFRHFHLFRLSETDNQIVNFEMLGFLKDDWGPKHGKPFTDWSLEDHQDWQTDYVTQKGQGDISLHSEEHLTRADAGISMTRRMFKKQAALVAAGQDPVGAGAGVKRTIRVEAGNSFIDPETEEVLVGLSARWSDL